DILIKDILIKDILIKDILIKDILIKDILIKDILIKDILIKDLNSIPPFIALLCSYVSMCFKAKTVKEVKFIFPFIDNNFYLP
ncbi:MAG: hypothetical protein WAT71_12355, partial [Ignavibacteria bacterium]